MSLTEATFAGLRAWLQTFAPTAVVGQTFAGCDCPLAMYLRKWVADGVTVFVDWKYVRVTDTRGESWYPLFDEASDFVTVIDAIPDADVVIMVTAEQALAALDEVTWRCPLPPVGLVGSRVARPDEWSW